MKLKFALAALYSVVSFSSKAQDLDNVTIKSQDVQGEIKMLTGWGGNIGFLTGSDGVVIIDDQMADLNQKITAEISNLTDQPIKYVINTHFHYDHTDGNKVLGKEGSLIISHNNVRKRLTTDQFIEYFKREQPTYPADALPKITFIDSLTLYLNGETLEIYHFPRAHTDGDAVIYFKESNVVHMGDILNTTGFPFIDISGGGTVPGVVYACDKVLAMTNKDTKFIPGHGVVYGWDELNNYRNMLAKITDRVTEKYKQGVLLSEINVVEMIKGYEEVKGRPAADFVMFVYLSLANN